MTPEQEKAANEAANKILAALRAARTPEECEEIGRKSAKVFARLQEVHPVRAIHIVNLADVKKREFAKNETATVPARRPRRRVATHQDQQGSLFD